MENRNEQEYRYDPKSSLERDVFNRYIQKGVNALSSREFRALQSDLDTAGGFMVTPVRVAEEILRDLDDLLFIRKLGKKIILKNAASFRAPYVANSPADPTWTAEILTGSEDSSMSLEGRNFIPHPCAERLLVSNTLLRIAVGNPEAIVRTELLKIMGQILESGYITGNGVNCPLGCCVDSANGIDASRDTVTAVSGSFTVDEIITTVGSLKSQYRRNSAWIVSRDFETALRRKKDGEGNYIYSPAISGSYPNILLGFPVYVSEYMPTYAAGNYAAIIGDWSFYWIVDSLEMQIKRLDELFAATNQTGFIIRYEGDAAPVVSEAFARLKLKT